MQVFNRDIERVLIVDDNPDVRDSFAYPIEEMELEPVKLSERINSTEGFIDHLSSADAVICDYHLKKNGFSQFDGDTLVETCFKKKVPGVLCTTFTDIDVTISRSCLRYIPSLITSISPSRDEIMDAWSICLQEMNGMFQPSRRPWRTQLRIEEVDHNRNCVYAVVPAWDVHNKIRIDRDDIPEVINESLAEDKILHAEVNIGAENPKDLYFVSWEPN